MERTVDFVDTGQSTIQIAQGNCHVLRLCLVTKLTMDHVHMKFVAGTRVVKGVGGHADLIAILGFKTACPVKSHEADDTFRQSKILLGPNCRAVRLVYSDR